MRVPRPSFLSAPISLRRKSIPCAAQNRDTTINKITPNLFRKYHGPADYVAVESEELEQDIHLSGFFRQKTKAIKALSQKLIDDFGGEVPQTMAELITLPGIGRKTANVVLGFTMGKAEGIVVDVHHLRVIPRLANVIHFILFGLPNERYHEAKKFDAFSGRASIVDPVGSTRVKHLDHLMKWVRWNGPPISSFFVPQKMPGGIRTGCGPDTQAAVVDSISGMIPFRALLFGLRV